MSFNKMCFTFLQVLLVLFSITTRKGLCTDYGALVNEEIWTLQLVSGPRVILMGFCVAYLKFHTLCMFYSK